MTEPGPKTRRSFLRFSLRAILLFVLATGVSLGWTLHKVREQGIAVAALEKLGLHVLYANKQPLTVLERLRMWYGEEEYGDAVSVLRVDPQATDAGLAHVERLTQLRWLVLHDTQVTDAGLAHLERLTQLQVLLLNETQVTDAGLAHLGRLAQLESLNLNGTQVTDAGLVHLERLTQLKCLYLDGTRVTDDGVKKLRMALPNCRISR